MACAHGDRASWRRGGAASINLLSFSYLAALCITVLISSIPSVDSAHVGETSLCAKMENAEVVSFLQSKHKMDDLVLPEVQLPINIRRMLQPAALAPAPSAAVNGSRNVSAIYAFGDSTTDTGEGCPDASSELWLHAHILFEETKRRPLICLVLILKTRGSRISGATHAGNVCWNS